MLQKIGATPEMTERPRDNTEYIVTKLKDTLESQPTYVQFSIHSQLNMFIGRFGQQIITL